MTAIEIIQNDPEHLTHPHEKTVVFVDDEAPMRRLIPFFLEKHPFPGKMNVYKAENSPAALEQLNHLKKNGFPVDLFIIDFYLNGGPSNDSDEDTAIGLIRGLDAIEYQGKIIVYTTQDIAIVQKRIKDAQLSLEVKPILKDVSNREPLFYQVQSLLWPE